MVSLARALSCPSSHLSPPIRPSKANTLGYKTGPTNSTSSSKLNFPRSPTMATISSNSILSDVRIRRSGHSLPGCRGPQPPSGTSYRLANDSWHCWISRHQIDFVGSSFTAVFTGFRQRVKGSLRPGELGNMSPCARSYAAQAGR